MPLKIWKEATIHFSWPPHDLFSDIGFFLGNTDEHCSTFKGPRPLATAVFVIGFWLLDVANNTVQGPIRALLADLSGPDQCNSANSIFCSWMAFGNILGFASGASGLWHKWFPFLTTKACCEVCGNLKAAFLVAVLFLLLCMSVTLYFAKEIPLEPKIRQHLSDSSPLLKDSEQYLGQFEGDETEKVDSGTLHVNNMRSKGGVTNSLDLEHHKNRDQSEAFNDGPASVLVNILTSLTHLPPGMHSVLLVMSLSWLSWFPFFLFDTDWMGREVYHGDPMGDITERTDYQTGVREGAIGLLLNSVVLGVSSFFVDPMCCKMGAKLVWAMSNFAVFICMAAATILNLVSTNEDTIASQHVLGGNNTVKAAALVIFSVLGFPLAIAYSVPFSMTAELTAGTGGGQGLATGVLNLAIVVPQTIVAIGAGPWDALFGGGNIPAFALPSIFSFAGGILAALKLPKLSSSHTSVGFHGFG
ncbi:sucrose transport protein SUT4-like isoform X2 [Zingiber officinale]|uniref:sucrose transport protein SUT4-like isoform X2 n=1 Tax=Zingiber officinale TaxID=94328 RepID=UPI001C4BA225|nr:sucrose transport protein SUT4-like isoform X2 [Zingiber officinale]